MIFQGTINILDAINTQAGSGGFAVIDDLGDYTSNIVGLMLTLAAVASLVYLVWGGITWITAGSDQGKVDEARQRLTNAVIGLGIVAASWAIFLLLDYFFGLGIANGGTP